MGPADWSRRICQIRFFVLFLPAIEPLFFAYPMFSRVISAGWPMRPAGGPSAPGVLLLLLHRTSADRQRAGLFPHARQDAAGRTRTRVRAISVRPPRPENRNGCA